MRELTATYKMQVACVINSKITFVNQKKSRLEVTF